LHGLAHAWVFRFSLFSLGEEATSHSALARSPCPDWQTASPAPRSKGPLPADFWLEKGIVLDGPANNARPPTYAG